MNIKNLVTSLREQLIEVDSERIAAGSKPLLELETVELEVNVTVSESADAKSGFDIKVLTLGGSISETQSEVHRVKVVYRVDDEARVGGSAGSRAHSSNESVTKRTVKPIS